MSADGFTVGDRVTHLNYGGNIDVVYGHVTEHDEAEQKTQVKWADGSGPTWHLTRALMLISTSDEESRFRPPEEFFADGSLCDEDSHEDWSA